MRHYYALRLRYIADVLKDKSLIFRSSAELSESFYDLSDYQSALRQIDIAQELTSVFRDPSLLVILQIREGDIYLSQGNFQNALHSYELALHTAKNAAIEEEEIAAVAAISNVYIRMLDYETALKHLELARSKCEGVIANRIKIKTYQRLAKVYNLMGEKQRAATLLQECTQLCDKHDLLEHQTDIKIEMCNTWCQAGDFRRACSLAAECLLSSQSQKYHHGEWKALMQLSQAAIGLGDFGSGIRYLTKASKVALMSRDRYKLAISQMELARVHHSNGKNIRAMIMARNAVFLLEDFRGTIRVEQQRSIFAAGFTDAYDILVSTLDNLKLSRLAHYYSECNKARVFYELMQSKSIEKLDFIRTAPDQVTRQEMLFNKLDKPLIRSNYIRKAISWIKGKIQSKEYSTKLESEDDIPDIDIKPVPVEQNIPPIVLWKVQRKLKKGKTIVQYHVGESSVIIWVITKFRINSKTVYFSPGELDNLVNTLRETISIGGQENDQARKLYDILIRPVINRIGRGEVIFILIESSPNCRLMYFKTNLVVIFVTV